VYDYSSQEGVGELAGWAHHHTVEQSEKVLNNFINNKDQLAIVYKDNNKVIGHIGIHPDSEDGREDTKELGYVLNKNYWNQGLMTEVLNAVLNYLFSKNINYVYACCFQNNIASKHLIEKCGFDFEQEGSFYAKTMDKTFETYEYVFARDKWNNDLG
jgi:ribosomal-protein-alanine N-acetyltransferase